MSQPGPMTPDSPAAYLNRELSWLSFARRVLALAEDPAQPLTDDRLTHVAVRNGRCTYSGYATVADTTASMGACSPISKQRNALPATIPRATGSPRATPKQHAMPSAARYLSTRSKPYCCSPTEPPQALLPTARRAPGPNWSIRSPQLGPGRSSATSANSKKPIRQVDNGPARSHRMTRQQSSLGLSRQGRTARSSDAVARQVTLPDLRRSSRA